MSSPAGAGRPLRADAQRNRDALVTAAATVFRTRGSDVSMLEIAEAAGVGVGTLYRHFPQREFLVAAVYQESLKELCAEAGDLLAQHPADQAIELWLRHLVDHVRVNLPLKLILMRTPEGAKWSPKGATAPPLLAESRELLLATIAELLDAAVRQGLVRPGTEPLDLLLMTMGVCHVDASAEEAGRMIGLLVNGLRYGGSGTSE
ncbi:MAG TPA: TetR/AcrR family transcriptional regulator [Pseudonocardiaceae bacterium]